MLTGTQIKPVYHLSLKLRVFIKSLFASGEIVRLSSNSYAKLKPYSSRIGQNGLLQETLQGNERSQRKNSVCFTNCRQTVCKTWACRIPEIFILLVHFSFVQHKTPTFRISLNVLVAYIVCLFVLVTV